MCMGLYSEVGAMQRRFEKSHCCAVSFMILVRNLITTNTFLSDSVKIVITRRANLDTCIDKWLRKRGDRVYVSNIEQTADPMQIRSTPLLILGFLEIGEYRFVIPSFVAQPRPVIVIPAMSTNVHHRIN